MKRKGKTGSPLNGNKPLVIGAGFHSQKSSRERKDEDGFCVLTKIKVGE